jgi:uncharacterized membrane protein
MSVRPFAWKNSAHTGQGYVQIYADDFYWSMLNTFMSPVLIIRGTGILYVVLPEAEETVDDLNMTCERDLL